MKILKVVALCSALVAAPAFAQKACSKADAAAAEKSVERVVNWQTLQKAYGDYGHCDEGPVGEVFTDAVLRLMLQWKDMDALANAVAKDAKYKEFLHKHLMSPAAADDRKDVYSRAKKDCPAKQAAFCDELADLVKISGGGKGKAAPGDAPFDLSPMKPLPTTK